MTSSTLVRITATAALLLVTATARFAIAAPAPADQETLAQARKEGSVTVYGSMTAPQLKALAARFEQQYGIRVDTLRMESNALPSRLMIEQRAGTARADVVDEPGFQIDLLKRQNLLAHAPMPENADMTAGTFDRDGYWSSIFINTDTIGYNPQLLKSAGIAAPKSWNDFTKPEWRGKFALFNGSYEWFAAMQHVLGKERNDQFMRSLAANGVHLVNSHQIAENMVEAGEYVAAVNTYGYNMARDQAKGLQAVNVNPDPTIVELHGVAIVAGAPHPNAARLFERWALSRETQSWIATSLGRISPRRDVKSNPAIWGSGIRFVISDPAESAHYTDYARDFNAIFGVGG